MNVYAIILASGEGKRAKQDMPKQYVKIAGNYLLSYSLFAFDAVEEIKKIVLVLSEEYHSFFKKKILPSLNLKKELILTCGGATRRISSLNGIMAAKRADFVLIHDGARPFIDKETIKLCIENTKKYSAAIVAQEASDTLKLCDDEAFVKKTISRENVYYAQTPQGFAYKLIKDAHLKNKDKNISDDAMLLEDVKIKIIKNNNFNMKITSKEDIKIAEKLIKFNQR